jgi:hypothetical protein
MIFKKTSYCVNVQSLAFNDAYFPDSFKVSVAATLESLETGIVKIVSLPCEVSSSSVLEGSYGRHILGRAIAQGISC